MFKSAVAKTLADICICERVTGIGLFCFQVFLKVAEDNSMDGPTDEIRRTKLDQMADGKIRAF